MLRLEIYLNSNEFLLLFECKFFYINKEILNFTLKYTVCIALSHDYLYEPKGHEPRC